MKKANKFFSVVLAIVLVLAMAIPAFAAETGTIEITKAVSGHTYTVYKMLDFTAAGEGGVYTVADGWLDFFNGATAANYFTVTEQTSDGKTSNIVTLKSGAEVDAALAQAAIAYAEENNIKADASTTASTDTVTFSGLDLGYYAVDTTVGTVCLLTNTNSKTTVTEKNSVPTLEKKILEGSAEVDANNAAIGDTVTYQVKIKVGEGAEKYVMHDKMSEGLTFGSVTSVKVGETDLSEKDYTVSKTADDDCTFEVAFTDAYLATLAVDTEIVVTYTATLNSNAIVGSDGNANTAWLAYGDDVWTDTDEDGVVDEGEEEPETTVEDTVITYTTKLTVNKIGDDDEPLAGAGFTLTDADGKTYEAVVSDDGTTFTWTGLKEGTYTLVETTVPAGYNKAADIVFKITCEEPTVVETGSEKATWSDNSDYVGTDGSVFTATVKNLTGETLPETGGIGTTIFYIVGGLLVVGAVILLITKKKMSAEV